MHFRRQTQTVDFQRMLIQGIVFNLLCIALNMVSIRIHRLATFVTNGKTFNYLLPINAQAVRHGSDSEDVSFIK